MSSDTVLIVGAGPTGLVLALWLTAQGTRVRIVDKATGPGTASRALAVQARTLELYQQLDLTASVLAQSHAVSGLNLWVAGKKAAHLDFVDIAGGLSAYGPLVFPQDRHERLLIERLASMGVTVERETALLHFVDHDDRVEATLQHADHREETAEVAYLAGCDGARSVVRQSLGTGFPGGTYQQLFYVADVEAGGPAVDGELHVDLDEADFLAVFPLKEAGCVRLIGTVRGERAEHADSLKFEDVSARAIEHMHVEVRAVNWFSTYRVHHRVTERFREGRVFLLGDAAHIHSPAGGQGMNTGIGDAINLAWKLSAVLSGKAAAGLLDTYESERRPFAEALVATTDKAFSLATAAGPLANFVRMHLVPRVAAALFKFERTREYLFSTVSQVLISYRDSRLSSGRTGEVHGGDRLPWVRTESGDNFAPLRAMAWQVHVYGVALEPLSGSCLAQGIALHVFPWHDDYAHAGLVRDAMYLLRPDTYVALASSDQNPDVLQRYFDERGISPK